MMDNPIIAEIRKVRREILESFGGDYHAMLRDAMKRQAESGRQVVSLGKKELQEGVSPDIYGGSSGRFRPE